MRLWFRCAHKKTSLPITRPRRDGEINRLADTYVVCLRCNERFPYSFQESRPIPERRKDRENAEADRQAEAFVRHCRG